MNTQSINEENTFNKNKDIYMNIHGKKVYSISTSIDDRIEFQNQLGITKKDLDNDEYNFIKLYTYEGYNIINHYFRKLTRLSDSEKESLKNKCEETWSKFKSQYDYIPFDNALKASETICNKGKILNEDLIVFRRQETPLKSYADNDIYHCDSFLSTSLYSNRDEFGEYLEYILIPKGKRILYISDISSNNNESEVLLTKNIDLKIIEEKSKYVTHWKMI